jgi:hypothetical protein
LLCAMPTVAVPVPVQLTPGAQRAGEQARAERPGRSSRANLDGPNASPGPAAGEHRALANKYGCFLSWGITIPRPDPHHRRRIRILDFNQSLDGPDR